MSEEALNQDVEVEADQQPDVEERARSMGWAPKEEFRGDPEKWVSAERFVERGENELPLLKAQLHRMEGELRESKKVMKEFAEYHTKTEQRAYERALSELRSEMRDAVETGDTAKFERADKQLENLQKEYRETAAPKPQSSEQPAITEAQFNEWVGENTWYVNDPVMKGAADAIGQAIQASNPSLVGVPFLKAVKSKLMEEMPHKFQNQRRSGAPAVEGVSSASSGKAGKKSFKDLPPEAKEACKKFAKRGLVTEEQYIKDFFGE